MDNAVFGRQVEHQGKKSNRALFESWPKGACLTFILKKPMQYKILPIYTIV
jgi:hypothetical protein